MKTTQKYGKNADLAMSMWVKLARASDTLAILTQKDIVENDLTATQFGVIEMLGHLGPMKIGEMCSKKLTTGGNMTVVIDNLEKLGLVERIKDLTDRRAYNVRLTEKGSIKFAEMFPKHALYVENLVWSVLNEQEIVTLSDLLKKLGTSLKTKL
ncbi:MAG: MarR family transcriptional regulator [Bacteroidota bacterium]|jgi:MarR family 2-MHQ and catechol resistance regulon transcriptional repressor